MNGINGASCAHSASYTTNGVANPPQHGTTNEVTANTSDTQDPRTSQASPIAIVGMAMRLPGGTTTSRSFWDMLIQKKAAQCPVPESRYSLPGFFSPEPNSGTVRREKGHFLENTDLQHLDTSFFSMSRAEVELLDPQQRQLLEVVWECLENAGETNWRGKEIGCFVGVFGEDWQDLHSKDVQEGGMYRITGIGDFVLGNRISYEYDFKGPSMTIKTGCSASLISLHMACQTLQTGDCSSAIVGGTNLIMTPTMTIAMDDQNILSPTGSCKTFDASADGYARGEAINAVYLKRLGDAIEDGDPIRAVIRGTSTNCDGKTPGIAHPSSESHEALIRRAYAVAGLKDFCETGFVECHGTGTPIGDPLEARALANVFGEKGVYIGSIKPNVGHSEGASGITGVIKATLALENRIIPPNINYSTPNPKIPWESGKLKVPVEPTPWPKARKERVSINSFGIGGANAHAILDSAASFNANSARILNGPSHCHSRLLVFSANHPNSLRALTDNYQRYVEENPSSLGDLAYTLSVRREHLPHRAFCVTNGGSPLDISTPSKASSTAPELVFVFTGQGAQWAQMGKELMEEFPAFMEDIRVMDSALADLPHPPSWAIEVELLKPKIASRLHLAEYAQPLCTAIQIALINLLRTFHIYPSAVVGHSSGEIAAAYAANAITAQEAITISYYRGYTTKSSTQTGGMAAVGLGREEVSKYLAEGVLVACENSPSSVTLSGDEDVIDRIVSRLKEEASEVFVRRLHVNMAYHSRMYPNISILSPFSIATDAEAEPDENTDHMQTLGETYESLMPHIKSATPTIPFYSSVTNEKIEPCSNSRPFGAHYWRQNLESPVLFSTATQTILESSAPSDTSKVFLEVGPHAALAGPLRQIFKATKSNAQYVATMARDANCTETLLKAAGQLYQLGYPIHFPAMNPRGKVLTDLPTYPWNHDKQYWSESRLSKGWRLRKFPHHEILGSRVVEGNDLEPTWRNMLRLDNAPWVRDHVVFKDVVFPGVGYVAMAGEAIRQLTGSGDYTVQRVVISQAMVLSESKAMETMTSLRPARLTDSLDSAWYDFTVMSYNGTSWTKNCVGQVRAGPVHTPIDTEKTPDPEPFPRLVSSSRWYKELRRVGIGYGPLFVGLTNISADVTTEAATATITNGIDGVSLPCGLHPTVMDMVLQLYSVAACQGLPRRVSQLCVPTYIEELYVRQASSAMRVEVTTSSTDRGTISGDATGYVDGEAVLRIRGLKLPPLDGPEPEPDPHGCHELDWKPHINFLDSRLREIIAPMEDVSGPYSLCEKLTILCILEIAHHLPDIPKGTDFLEKYRDWIYTQVARAARGDYDLVPDAQNYTTLTTPARLALIDSTLHAVTQTDASPLGLAIHKIYLSTSSIFSGETDPLELLLRDNLLAAVYDFGDRWNYRTFLRLVSHLKPNLHILEIGAGTGGTTETVLKDLDPEEGGTGMYASYTYTDISAGFFVAAKERFRDARGMAFKVLDITKDPVAQGFAEGAYDLILASNVIHSTPNIHESLLNVRKLLSPRGRFLLQELCTETKCINYVMGMFPGWWLGSSDGPDRLTQPYITPERWDLELKAAGFRGTDVVVHDHPGDFKVNAIIVATPSPPPEDKKEKRVTLLHGTNHCPVVSTIETHLRYSGYSVDLYTLYQDPTTPLPPNQDILSLLDLEAPFFSITSPTDFSAFINFISTLPSSIGILWATRSLQIKCQNPDYALVLGMARTIRCELGLDFATLELDTIPIPDGDAGGVGLQALSSVLGEFQNRPKGLLMDPDWEYALSDGVIHVPRYRPVSVPRELAKSSEGGPVRKLVIGKRGLLQTLQWVERPMKPVLEGDDVEIVMKTVGLNFKDVLIAMGIIEGRVIEGRGLGCEGAGIVRRVGPNIKHLKPGDSVIYFGMGAFSTIVLWDTESGLLIKIPEGMNMVDAATIPAVYGTVVHSLLDVGRLQKGQTVLIQSACGGVGLAAIDVCKMVGAEIYCTVGTPEKRTYLTTHHSIPPSHIFPSHTAQFLPLVLRATKNRGVDLVLNSLTGDLFHASWQCVAEFGCMIEIGKRDFIGRAKLDVGLFERNRAFFGVDFAAIYHHNPELNKSVLDKALQLLAAGHLHPIPAKTLFPASQILDAFRYMQKGTHIGKIIVEFPDSPSSLLTTPTPPPLLLKKSNSYLLVGGLGGLGKAVAVYLAEHGAGNIIFLGRTAGKGEGDEAVFRELRAMGCGVQAFQGNVCERTDVENLISMAASPIAGVINMSMVISDKALPEMSHSTYMASLRPKVQGTWTLHEALLNESLDFFLLFSSTSGMAGWWGQANYSSANTFLDAFVSYRHALGLPASVLVVGAIEDVGYVSEKPAVLELFRSRAIKTMREAELLEGVHLAITRSKVPPLKTKGVLEGHTNKRYLAIGVRSTIPFSAPENRAHWKRDIRLSPLLNLTPSTISTSSSSSSTSTPLSTFLQQLAQSPQQTLLSPSTPALLTSLIATQLSSFLLLPESEPLDVKKPLQALGVDSLIAIEIRNWWRQSFGVEVGVLDVLGTGSVEELGWLAVKGLAGRFGVYVGGEGEGAEKGDRTIHEIAKAL